MVRCVGKGYIYIFNGIFSKKPPLTYPTHAYIDMLFRQVLEMCLLSSPTYLPTYLPSINVPWAVGKCERHTQSGQ